MQTHHQSSRYHVHRYHLEQDALLSGVDRETPAQTAIRVLDARLKSIAVAENALASDITPQYARAVHVRTLGGRSAGEARAEAYRVFRMDYGSAVAGERVAA